MPRVDSTSQSELDALVDEAIVDCNGDDEQLTGLFTIVEDNLATPFRTQVLSVEVTVSGVKLVRREIVAVCHGGRVRQAIGITDLPLPTPPPQGMQWAEAYQHWAGSRRR